MSPGVALVIALSWVAVAVWFDVICLRDLAKTPRVRYLTHPMWAVAIVLTFPLGGILYLTYGRPR
jgi:hypothetical protein